MLANYSEAVHAGLVVGHVPLSDMLLTNRASVVCNVRNPELRLFSLYTYETRADRRRQTASSFLSWLKYLETKAQPYNRLAAYSPLLLYALFDGTMDAIPAEFLSDSQGRISSSSAALIKSRLSRFDAILGMAPKDCACWLKAVLPPHGIVPFTSAINTSLHSPIEIGGTRDDLAKALARVTRWDRQIMSFVEELFPATFDAAEICAKDSVNLISARFDLIERASIT